METLWSCRTCMACVEICPVAVEHVPIIVQMRRKLVEDGAMDPLLHEDAADHSQDRQFVRRIEAQARRLEQGPALPGQGRAQGAGGRAVVRRRLRLLRSAQSEGDADLRDACCTRPASTSAFSTTANRMPATMCAASARRVCTKCWPTPMSRAGGRLVQDHRHHRSALLQYDPQRIPRLRRQVRDPALHDASLQATVRRRASCA